MKCTKCGALTKVLESREKASGLIRRRRECLGCKYRFTTYEADSNTYRIKKMTLETAKSLPLLARELVRQHLLVEHKFNLVELDADFTNLPPDLLHDYREAETAFLAAAMLTTQHHFQITYDGQPFNIRCDSDFEEVAIDFPVLLGVA